MKDAGLYVSDLYCTLSDAQLDEVVRNVFQQFPNSGYCMMAGHLWHLNIHVQQLRIRIAFTAFHPPVLLLGGMKQLLGVFILSVPHLLCGILMVTIN